MSLEYDTFKKLLSQKKFREAALYAEEQYFIDKNIFWINQQAYANIRAGNYKTALEHANEVLALESNNTYALMTAADALYGLHRYNEAIEYYKEAIHRERVRIRASRRICECLAQLKKWKELLDFSSSLSIPEQEYIRYKIKALRSIGNKDQALQLCREALTRLPDNPGLLWELTELEIETNGIDRVIEQMGRLAKIKTLPPIYKEIYASICRRAGKDDLALKAYDTIGSGVQDIRIQRKKAFTLAKTGQEKQALPLLEELIKLNPGDMYLHASYGAACARIGEIERGINFYHALLAMFPDQKGIYGYITKLKKKLGKK